MTTEKSVVIKIANNLLLLHQQRATGELVITHAKQPALQWRLYFYLGRLVYATGGEHLVRRWYRAFKYNCPDCYIADWLAKAQSDELLWEVDLLNQALSQGQITMAHYKVVIQSVVREVMFTIVGQRFLTTHWHPDKRIAQQTVFLSIEQLIQEAQALREHWRTSGLGFLQELMFQFSPDLAPIIKNRLHLDAQVFPIADDSLIRLLKGQLTLWDIALETQRSLPDVSRALLPLIRLGVIELKEIPDLPSPCPQPLLAPPVPSPNPQARVAYIDDNPLNGRAIAQILQPHGYEVLTIHKPLQGLAMLLERKPNLILLDPVMSTINGYEFCTLLRKTAVFQNTPIVILTGQDGMFDRVRAKLAGASEFVAKPLESAKVLQVVQKYLSSPIAAKSGLKPGSQSNWIVA